MKFSIQKACRLVLRPILTHLERTYGDYCQVFVSQWNLIIASCHVVPRRFFCHVGSQTTTVYMPHVHFFTEEKSLQLQQMIHEGQTQLFLGVTALLPKCHSAIEPVLKSSGHSFRHRFLAKQTTRLHLHAFSDCNILIF